MDERSKHKRGAEEIAVPRPTYRNELLDQTSKKLRLHGSLDGVNIFRCEGVDGMLSGVIFGADGMLMTAGHVAENHKAELPNFDIYPENFREIDIAVRKNPAIKGPHLGYVDSSTLEGCLCIVSQATDLGVLIMVHGTMMPFYEPTLLSQFVPDNVTDTSLFGSGTSGSPILYKGNIIGFIKGSSTKTVTSVCFKLPELRETLRETLGLSFKKLD